MCQDGIHTEQDAERAEGEYEVIHVGSCIFQNASELAAVLRIVARKHCRRWGHRRRITKYIQIIVMHTRLDSNPCDVSRSVCLVVRYDARDDLQRTPQRPHIDDAGASQIAWSTCGDVAKGCAVDTEMRSRINAIAIASARPPVPAAAEEIRRWIAHALKRAQHAAAKADLRQARQRLKPFVLSHGIRYSGNANWGPAHRRWISVFAFPNE
jgi:hypothetical protein